MAPEYQTVVLTACNPRVMASPLHFIRSALMLQTPSSFPPLNIDTASLIRQERVQPNQWVDQNPVL